MPSTRSRLRGESASETRAPASARPAAKPDEALSKCAPVLAP